MLKADNISLVLDKYVVLSRQLEDGREVGISCEYIASEPDRLFLKFPNKRRNMLRYFPEDKDVKVSITSPAGLITYDGIILYTEPFPLVVVSYHISNTSVAQKREDLRVEYVAKINITYNEEEYKCLTENVSSSGFKFVSPIEIPQEEFVDAKFYLRDFKKPISMSLKIINCFNINKTTFNIHSKITDISALDKKRIQKFCYDEQRNLLENNE